MTRHHPDLVSAFWLVEANLPSGTTNQKNYSELVSDGSSVWNFCACFSDGISRGNQWQCRKILAFCQAKTTPVDIGRFPLSPKYRIFWLEIKRNWRLIWPEYLGPALKVVQFDQSAQFGRSDRNVIFQLTKLLSPEQLFCILLTWRITKRAVAWVVSVQPECTVPLVRGISETSLNRNYCWMGSAHKK